MLTYTIAQEMNISSATYSRKQEQALCEFADRFEYQVMKHNIIGEVSDLHVYLENDKWVISDRLLSEQLMTQMR